MKDKKISSEEHLLSQLLSWFGGVLVSAIIFSTCLALLKLN